MLLLLHLMRKAQTELYIKALEGLAITYKNPNGVW